VANQKQIKICGNLCRDTSNNSDFIHDYDLEEKKQSANSAYGKIFNNSELMKDRLTPLIERLPIYGWRSTFEDGDISVWKTHPGFPAEVMVSRSELPLCSKQKRDPMTISESYLSVFYSMGSLP